MAKKKRAKRTAASLSAEIDVLRTEVAKLREAVGVLRTVSTTVEGPRRSEVAVDAVVIPMTGEFTRSESRPVNLQPPDVTADLPLHGQVGTSTTFTLEINGVAKKKTLVLTASTRRGGGPERRPDALAAFRTTSDERPSATWSVRAFQSAWL